MNVGELIEELQTLDPILPIFVSEDDEGNGYYPLHRLYTGYRAREFDRYAVELVHEDDISEDSEWWEPDYSEYDIKVVVLG